MFSGQNTVVLVQTSLRTHATARFLCTYKYRNFCNDIFKTKFHIRARLPSLMKDCFSILNWDCLSIEMFQTSINISLLNDLISMKIPMQMIGSQSDMTKTYLIQHIEIYYRDPFYWSTLMASKHSQLMPYFKLKLSGAVLVASWVQGSFRNSKTGRNSVSFCTS